MSAPDEHGQKPYDCNECPPLSAEGSPKRGWHCGYVPREEWTTCDLPPAIGIDGMVVPLTTKTASGEYEPIDICPGWIVRQPAMIEASYACAAAKNGDLTAYFPGCENPIMEAAMEMTAAWNEYENARVQSTSKKTG